MNKYLQNKTLFLAIALVVVFGWLVCFSPFKKTAKVGQTGNATNTGNEPGKAVVLPTPVNEDKLPVQQKADRQTLKKVASETDPLIGDDFQLFYMSGTDKFVGIIYYGDREEVIQRVYGILRARGVKEPEKLNIDFSGPRDYNQYEP